jgi:alpha 1,2-mannosyltransferase
MLALRKRWALPGRYVGGGGLPRGTPSGDFCAHTMQQYDHAARPMFIHYNLLKQIPSGVFLGFTWGRTKQVAAFPTPPAPPPATLTWNTTHVAEPYPDRVVRGADDVEADMLANADDDGWTIYPGSDEVRRRAALERGIRPFFHGGGNSAFCIDMRWEDPAPKDQPRSKHIVKQGDEEKLVSAPNQLGIDWDTSPLEVSTVLIVCVCVRVLRNDVDCAVVPGFTTEGFRASSVRPWISAQRQGLLNPVFVLLFLG